MTEESNWYQKPDVPGVLQFLYLILLTIGGLVLMSVISIFLLLSHYGINDLRNFDLNNLPWNLTEYLMLVQDFCLFGVPAIVFAMIVKRRNDYFYIHNKSSFSIWFIVILIAISGLFVSDLLGQLNEWIPLPKNLAAYFKSIEKSYDQEALSVLNFKSFGTFLISLLTIALLPAIFEELFFRGALQRIMITWTKKPIAGIIITAILFSAFHLSYYGFLPRFALGLVLGLIYFYGKNIWLNMLVHFINNATVVVTLYITTKGKPLTTDILNNDTQNSPLYMQLIGVAALIILMNIFIKKSKSQITNS